jgi:hypothetical protein
MDLSEGGHIMLKVKRGGVPVRVCGHNDVGKVLKVVVGAWAGLDVEKSVDDINGEKVAIACGDVLHAANAK